MKGWDGASTRFQLPLVLDKKVFRIWRWITGSGNIFTLEYQSLQLRNYVKVSYTIRYRFMQNGNKSRATGMKPEEAENVA